MARKSRLSRHKSWPRGRMCDGAQWTERHSARQPKMQPSITTTWIGQPGGRANGRGYRWQLAKRPRRGVSATHQWIRATGELCAPGERITVMNGTGTIGRHHQWHAVPPQPIRKGEHVAPTACTCRCEKVRINMYLHIPTSCAAE